MRTGAIADKYIPKGLKRFADNRSAVPRSALLSVAIYFCLAPIVSRTLEAQSPFVAAFDRFARHGEIDAVTAGSLLISELSCTACHPTSDPQLQPKKGPVLSGAGVRLRADWIRAYLSQPHAAKPGTTMPHVMAPAREEHGDSIDSIVAFLTSLRDPFAVVKAGGALPVVHEFWKRGDPQRGKELYHTVGCVACHEPDADYQRSGSKPSEIDALIEQLDPEELEELGLSGAARRVESVPHGDLATKYSLRSLTMLLLDPEKTRPASRMPSLRLSPGEAADLAAHLLPDANPHEQIGTETPSSLVEKGRTLFIELRCVNCHVAGGAPKTKASPSTELFELNVRADSSCLQHPSAKMPRYHLDPAQVDAIRRRLAIGSRGKLDPAREVAFRLLQLNCYACHQRDTIGGVGRFRKAYFETAGQVDLGDEGRLPPPLTGIGRKLQSKTLAGVFHPKTAPHRPHMTIRMPSYRGETVKRLVSQLPVADDADTANDAKVFDDSAVEGAGGDLLEAGRRLINTGCVECHPIGGENLPGVVGVDLDGVTGRVHPRWFYDFVLNPGRVKKRTRMPTFFPDGKSNRADLLGGDVDRQIAAIWVYLKHLGDQPMPEKIAKARSANYELKPAERPIVLRTFMDAAGTHAIAVGFPQGIHYAFDADQVRLAIGWKGRFLDARGTWFERFTPPAEPLGEPPVTFPPGLPLADPQQSAYRMGGYRLDAEGVPTLLYQLGQLEIEDRIEATGAGSLKRTWMIRGGRAGAARRLTLKAAAGNKLDRRGPMSMANDRGLTVTLSPEVGHAGELHRTDQELQWLIPLTVHESLTVGVEYTW